MIKQALISVSDKTGIVELAKVLQSHGIQILSTGGTAKLLENEGVTVTEVADYTGFPEMLDGRVKTLHPKVHAGILARRNLPEHVDALNAHAIPVIDMVIVNLYPFQETIAQPDCVFADAIENIDIGGPAMLRSAAKNYADVVAVCDPHDYAQVIETLNTRQGHFDLELRLMYAQKIFAHTAQYDAAVAGYLHRQIHAQVKPARSAANDSASDYPDLLTLSFQKIQTLRYGENPHQSAAFYRDRWDERNLRNSFSNTPISNTPAANLPKNTLAHATQLQGKELSYNNIADADAAWECVKTFTQTDPQSPVACVIVKHANPCGVAIAETAEAAYRKALQTDPTSAFGGIIAFNAEVDGRAAERIAAQFLEVLIAPSFSPEARKIFTAKPNVRLLEISLASSAQNLTSFDYKRIGGGLLVQTPDQKNVASTELRVATFKQPTSAQLQDLLFAWRVAKFVKSNAIVFCGNGMTLGIGAGQMSRIDSAKIAAIKAKEAQLPLTGSAVASDAFFPFRDGLDVVIDAGASCVIQPGGSLRDQEVIDAANERGICMVLTGTRHFRH